MQEQIEKHSGYKIMKKVGKGSFGTVYEAIKKNKKVALKVEQKDQINSPQLDNEYKVYCALQGTRGVPIAYYFGSHGNLSYLATQLLDFTLSDILERRGKFSLKTVAIIGKRLISIIEAFHKKEFLYRDMKPENIMVRGNEIYLVDYGMCKPYMVGTKHIPLRTNKVLTGTARYTSIATHLGYEQGRRDDLECIGYVLVFLLSGGELPWMRIPAPTRKEKYQRIGQIKESTPLSKLCGNLPGGSFLEQFIQYSRDLSFEERPDYDLCRGIFDKMMAENGMKDDNVYDWTPKKVGNENGFVNRIKRMFSWCGSESQIRAKSHS